MPISSPFTRGEAIRIPFYADTDQAENEIRKLSNQLDNVGKSNVAGSAFSGAFFGSVAFRALQEGFNFIVDSFEEVIDLAEEQPELFDAQQLQNVHEYGQAVDNLKNTFTEFKIELVSGVAPALTEILLGLNNTADIRERANELVAMGASREQALAQASREVNDATREYIPVAKDAADAQKEYNKAINEAIKVQNTFYKSQISTLGKLKDLREGQIEDEGRIRERQQDIVEAINRENIAYGGLVNGINWVRNANGRLVQERGASLAQSSEHLVKIKELEGEYADLTLQLEDVARQSAETRNQMIFDSLQEKLAADGVTTSAEYLYELQVGKQLGLFTEADVKTLQDINQAADEFASAAPQALSATELAFKNARQPMAEVKEIMDDLAAYDGKVINFGVNFWTAGAFAPPVGSSTTSRTKDARIARGTSLDYYSQEISRRLTQ